MMRLSSEMTAAAGSVPYFWSSSYARAEDKNDRPNIASIGVGGMGSGDGRSASRFGNMVACADVDRSRGEKFAAHEQFQGRCEVYTDYHKILERNDIEVVLIGVEDAAPHAHVGLASQRHLLLRAEVAAVEKALRPHAQPGPFESDQVDLADLGAQPGPLANLDQRAGAEAEVKPPGQPLGHHARPDAQPGTGLQLVARHRQVAARRGMELKPRLPGTTYAQPQTIQGLHASQQEDTGPVANHVGMLARVIHEGS